MKKCLAAILAVALICTAGCSSTNQTSSGGTSSLESSQSESESTSAAGEGDDREFTLRLAVSSSSDIVEQATEIFKEKYPNATVEQIDSPWGSGGADARNKQLIMLSGGEQIDIGKVVWGKEFFQEGIILDITEEVQTFDIFPNLTEGQKERMSLDGKYYATTTTNNTVFLFYNKDILSQIGITEPPKTIEELEAIGTKLKAADLKTADGKPIYLTNFEGGNWTTDYWLWAFGGKQMNDDYTQTLINSEESINAFSRMQKYITDGWAPKLDGTGDQAWLNGQLAFYVTGDWVVSSTNEAGINVGYAVMPTGENGKATTSIGGAEWVVFSGSSLQDEAIEWLRALASDEFQEKFPRVTNIKYYDDPEKAAAWKEAGTYEAMMVEKDQLMDTTYNFLEAPYSFPDGASIYGTALEEILTGLKDPAEVMNAAAEEINAGIEQFYQ